MDVEAAGAAGAGSTALVCIPIGLDACDQADEIVPLAEIEGRGLYFVAADSGADGSVIRQEIRAGGGHFYCLIGSGAKTDPRKPRAVLIGPNRNTCRSLPSIRPAFATQPFRSV